MDGSASNTLRTLLEQMQSAPLDTIMANKTPPKSSADIYPTFLYKISPVLSVQQSPSMVQASSSSPQNINPSIMCSMPSNVASASASISLEDMGLRRTRTVIPNSVKVQIAKVANQIPRMTQGEIAQMFGIDRTTVSKILKRRREYLCHEPDSPNAKYSCPPKAYSDVPRHETSSGKRVPNILSTSKVRIQREMANHNSPTLAGVNRIPKQQSQAPSPKPVELTVTEIKEEVMEIEDSEALSREMNNLDKFRDQQKMIEEANKQRKALLSKTLTERQRKAREEAQKLSHIQKEVQLLDNRLSADVTLIRSRIESASKDYMEAQRRYDRAEREFIEAKMDLQKKSELKEQLTEHLYTIIHQNELRKAEKLSQLMNELHVEMENEENGIKLNTSLPPLSAFNAANFPSLQRTKSHDAGQPGSSSSKNGGEKSTDTNKSENSAGISEFPGLAKDDTVICINTESLGATDKLVNDCVTVAQTATQSSVVRRHEDGVQQGNAETKSCGSNVEKLVPTSWTLDVVIKKEPEESV